MPPPVNLGPDITVSYGFCDTVIHAGNRFVEYTWKKSGSADTISEASSLSVSESGTYSVTVTDIFGFTSTDAINVTIPNYSFISDTAFCAGSTFVWNPGFGTNYHYHWQDNSSLPTLSVSQTGVYSVTVTDANNCSITSGPVNISKDNFETEAWLGNDTNLCSGNMLYLKTGFDKAHSYLWSNGSINNGIPVVDSGNYSVSVTDINGCHAIDSIHITISGVAPVAGFYQGISCNLSPVDFTDTSVTDSGQINKWLWIFNNRHHTDSILTTNPSYLFDTAGTYLVTLFVTNTEQCIDSAMKYIMVHPLPVAGFSPDQGCTDINTNFTDQSSVTGETIAPYHEWDFGDGNYSTVANPAHIYNIEGTYLVKLVAWSDAGCVDSTWHNITVKPSPVVDFSYSTPCLGHPVEFYSDITTPNYWPLIDENWSFGDTHTSQEYNPKHLYSAAGTYPVSLWAKSVNGCAQSTTKDITVHLNPVANFSNLSACVDAEHKFTDGSTCSDGSIIQWNWNIDNYGYSPLREPVVVFNTAGIYNAQLIVSSSSGCLDTIKKVFTVHPSPVTGFDFDPKFGVVPLNVNFTNTSTGNTSSHWYFGNGDTSISSIPVYQYNSIGNFNISLVTSNSFGCKDSVSKSIIVASLHNDIAVVAVHTVIKDNYLWISADIVNMGTIPVDTIKMVYNIGGEHPIMEIWPVEIRPGQVKTYNFNSLYKLTDGEKISYLCVRADYFDNSVDNVPENNEKCNVSDDGFSVLEPYPNPANNSITIEFIMPVSTPVRFDLFSDEGKLMLSKTLENTVAGLNRISLDLTGLSNGTFTFQLSFDDQKQTKKFIKYNK